MKVWITKYALTSGVFEAEGEQAKGHTEMVTYQRGPMSWHTDHAHGEGREWHRTKASATARVLVMIDRKIASLREQIVRLEVMRNVY